MHQVLTARWFLPDEGGGTDESTLRSDAQGDDQRFALF